jgi:hypothetical protein
MANRVSRADKTDGDGCGRHYQEADPPEEKQIAARRWSKL